MEENTTTGAEALAEGVKGRADAGAVRPADYASLDDDPAAGLPPPAINDIDLVVDVPMTPRQACRHPPLTTLISWSTSLFRLRWSLAGRKCRFGTFSPYPMVRSSNLIC
ncbi:MAG: hypothetical protein RIQ29_77 [Pseudomonadota bacterium]